MNAIEVKNLSKKFRLYRSDKKRILEMLTCDRVKMHTDFWALKDINFEVPQASTLGIIGQNGSGKSTLLSILAGVLQSTEGTFFVNGRVSALLELGAGFHPEFSGRDNVYMYGTIMGLSKKEIDKKFEEIVDFSELHEFIDQSLRTYSSGMAVRLAFSVAVNVDADILIVDEALAVGDALFQHRCFSKMRQLQEEGKTIIFVSHDTNAVEGICDYAHLLDGGLIIKSGEAADVVKAYNTLILKREKEYHQNRNKLEHARHLLYRKDDRSTSCAYFGHDKRIGDGRARILRIKICNIKGVETSIFQTGEHAFITIQVELLEDIHEGFNIGYTISNKYGEIYNTNARLQGHNFGVKKRGDFCAITFKLEFNLGHGVYSISCAVAQSFSRDHYVICDWFSDSSFIRISYNPYFTGVVNLQSVVSSVD